MFKLPLFGKKKLLLAFEYGLVIDLVAKEHNVEVSKELIKKVEDIILQEFTENTSTHLAVQMVPNILSAFETKLDV